MLFVLSPHPQANSASPFSCAARLPCRKSEPRKAPCITAPKKAYDNPKFQDDVDSPTYQKELKKQRSFSECYFVVKGAALILPHDECRHVRRKSHSNGACVIQNHLKSMCNLIREEDTLRMAVKLETAHPGRTRYLVVISNTGSQDTEECCLLGVDCNNQTSIGLVLPVWADTRITLDGDGGFSVSSSGRHHIFKPVSVQAMWSALQTLHKSSAKARGYNYFMGGGTHQWIEHYEKIISSDRSCLNEWHAMDDLISKRPPSPDAVLTTQTERDATEKLIRTKLKEVMMSVDLDEVTSKFIRTGLEEQLGMSLNEYKSYIDQEMLVILGQMDAPTEIFEYLYLGSEWNASNLEELKVKGVDHILNVTREIDNFFPGMFDYLNVRVYDDETTEMLKHWDKTYKYIRQVKAQGSKVLVHCKMGISRSASVVVAYVMKAYDWNLAQALDFVKNKRTCIKPNSGFIEQLVIYQGILDASKHRHNSLWRSKSETNLNSCDRDSHEKDQEPKLDPNKRYNLYLSMPGLTPRPKSWSPRDAFLDALFPSCHLHTETAQGQEELPETTFKPLRQRSGTDPTSYLNLEVGSLNLETKVLQNLCPPCSTPNQTVPRVSSIKDRINELVSQVTCPPDLQKTASKVEMKLPSVTSASKAGLVLNLAHQFEGGSKPNTPSPVEDCDTLETLLTFKTPLLQGVEPVLSQTKLPALKHQAVLIKPNPWTTNTEVTDMNSSVFSGSSFDNSEKAFTDSGLGEEGLTKKPSQTVKDLFSRQSSGVSQVSDPFSWSRQSSCSSCSVSVSPPVQWFIRDKDTEVCSCSQDEQLHMMNDSSKEFSLDTQAIQHRLLVDPALMNSEIPSDSGSPPAVLPKGEFLYHKEDIPWTPGTVRRTKQQIEEKNLKRTTSYDSGFPGQSHSTPSTPPELSPDSDSGASVVRSQSLRNELRPRSMVFPSRWHPSPRPINCSPQMQKGSKDDEIFIQNMPHSVSTPSVVEAVNEVLCGTRVVLNSAIQSLPSSQYTSDDYGQNETDDSAISSEDPLPNIVKQQRDILQTHRNTQELSSKSSAAEEKQSKKDQLRMIKDFEQTLVTSQTDEGEGSCGVVKRLTKELEAKTGSVPQKKERIVIVSLESKDQEQVKRLSHTGERENCLVSSSNLGPAPSLSKRCKSLFSNENPKDSLPLPQKPRTLSDVSSDSAPTPPVPHRKTSFDLDRLRKCALMPTQNKDLVPSEQNKVKPLVRSVQMTNGYQGPSYSRNDPSPVNSGGSDAVSSQTMLTISSDTGKPPPGTKSYGTGVCGNQLQLNSQKKNRKMQQGKSHPLSKLTAKQRHANPLYNTM